MRYESDRLIMIPFNRNLLNGNYKYWWSDADVTRHNSHGLFPQSEKELEEWFLSIGRNNIVMALISKIDPIKSADENNIGKLIHIGNASLQRIDLIHRSAEFAIIIGEKSYWGKGYAVEAGVHLFEHGFKKLGLNRIWTGTAATNIGMQNVCTKLKMTHEGTSREGMYLDGKFIDVFHYGVLRNEWIGELTNE